MRRIRLPDGTKVVGPGKLECRFLYHEIFVDRAYQNGSVRSRGCVVDIGAHVGLFGLWASRNLEPSRLLLFEPIPSTFALLEENARCHFPSAECHNLGLDREPGVVRFRHYPNAVGCSSMMPREDLLRESLLTYLQHASLGFGQECFKFLGRIAPSAQHALHDRVCDRIFANAQKIDCRVISLSGLIEGFDVDRIELLKLDVEGAEYDIMSGLTADHWPRIQAITAEVEDTDGKLRMLSELIESKGLRVHTRQVSELAGTPFHLLWADRSP